MIKKIFKNKSLAVRIPLINTGIVLIIMSIVCISMSMLTRKTVGKLVQQEISYIADANGALVSSCLESMYSVATSITQEIERYEKIDEDIARELLIRSITESLDNEILFATYFAFEPNAYFENTPKGLSAYAYKDNTEVVLEILEDYDNYYMEDYYTVPKETKAIHITEPYIYELTEGKNVWLITIAVPIIGEDGDFLGVVNSDVLAESFTNLNYVDGGFESAYSYIITESGTYIAHSANQELVGDQNTANQEVKSKISNGEDFTIETIDNDITGNLVWKVYKAIDISGLDAEWSSVFVAVQSESYAQVNLITVVLVIIGIFGTCILAVASTKALRKGLAPIEDVMEMAEKMGQCDLKNKTQFVKTEDELGELAQIFEETSTTLGTYIEEVSIVLEKIANGNLDVEISKEYIGDFAQMKDALSLIIDSLNDTFNQIHSVAELVASGSEQVAASATVLSEGVMEQAAAVEELSVSISSISDQVNENAENAMSANVLSNQTGQKIMEGNEQMQVMVEAMEQIKDSAHEISNIIKTINDIAFQTNMLALNAAIEAARAGETGKGFAVIADQVRALAQKSAEAAQNTTTLIETTISAVDNGTTIAYSTAESLNIVVESASVITKQIKEMAEASEHQAVAITQINQGIEQIANVVQNNSATAQESAASSEELSAQAQTLNELISKFNLKK